MAKALPFNVGVSGSRSFHGNWSLVEATESAPRAPTEIHQTADIIHILLIRNFLATNNPGIIIQF